MKITVKVLYKLIYVFIFLLFFAVLTFIFFPYGELKKSIELSIYDNTGLKTTIKSVGPSFLFGLNLSGVKIYGFSSKGSRPNTVADINNIQINNIIPAAADYLFFKDIPVNLSFNDIKIHPIKKDFINIPELNLKTLNAKLYIKNAFIGNNAGKAPGKSGIEPAVSLSGRLWFSGDLTGSLNVKKAELEPLFKINNGIFKVKPVKSVYGKFSMLFTTMFKKSKNGYFIYSINNLVI